MTLAHRHVLIAAHLPTSAPGLVTFTHALIAALTGNPHVPTPNPPLSTLLDLVTKLETAQTATKSRTAGTVGARNSAKGALISAVRTEIATIQALADADPDNAEAIITSTSLTLRKKNARTKASFAVKQGEVSGTVHLAVKSAGARAAYDWQWSSDGGKTWTQVESTTQAKTSIASLPAGTTVSFRFRSVTPKGQSDWSAPLSFLVK
jgi:hypothetical protein